MADLMELVVMPDTEGDSPLLGAYRDRFNDHVGRTALTRGPQWAAMAARWAEESPGLRAEHAARLRERRQELLRTAEATAAELAALADAFDDPGEGQ